MIQGASGNLEWTGFSHYVGIWNGHGSVISLSRVCILQGIGRLTSIHLKLVEGGTLSCWSGVKRFWSAAPREWEGEVVSER